MRALLLGMACVAWLAGCAKHDLVEPDMFGPSAFKPPEGVEMSPPGGPLRTCLALSGGGLRSASFSIGVMKGLQQIGALSQVDAISAVSGGGYAMTWYLANFARRLPPDASSDPSPSPDGLSDARADVDRQIFANDAIDALLDHADFVDLSAIGAKEVSLGAFKSLYDMVNRLAGADPPPTIAHTDYVDRITQAFHSGRRLRWDELDRSVRLLGAPFPILSAVGTLPHPEANQEKPGLNQLFEMTPRGMAMPWFGFELPAKFPLDVSETVAVSGAATDEVYWKGYSPIANALRAGLGFTWTTFEWKDANGKQRRGVYLTDGGYAENLAIYPLLRRGCKRIVAVDAEEDAGREFEGFDRLETRIGRPIVFEKPASPTTPTESAALASLKASSPLAFGRIEPQAGTQGKAVELVYIKLSWERSWSRLDGADGRIFAAVRDYVDPLGCDVDPKGKGCAFPQDPTKNQSYSRAQMKAYIHLGWGVVNGHERCLLQDGRMPARAAQPFACP